jgi:hypothetical protein
MGGNNMFGGLRPYQLTPINRGCVNTIVFLAQNEDGTWIDKTDKRLFLTCKAQPWDDDAEDTDAKFKIEGTIPNAEDEPGRVVFTLTEEDSYLDPEQLYFVDIVETDSDGTSNANRLFIGNFNVIAGPNNAEAGGEEE